MKNAPALLLALAAVTLASVVTSSLVVAAPACDIPLVVQENAVAPNVLIVLDTSGSMRSAIFHPAFDTYATYTGPFATRRTYYVRTPGLYQPNDFQGDLPGSPSAPLVGSELGLTGRYRGNYLNWVFYHASDSQRNSLPQITRIEAGKAAVTAVLSQVPHFRYGLMRFNGNDGGLFLADIGTPVADLFPVMEASRAGGNTPTAESLVDALEYFRRQDADAPILQACQRNFIIVVTDGYPTRDLDVPSYIGDQDGDGREPGDCDSIGSPSSNRSECSDYMDDVAYYLANNDLRPDLDGEQVAYTYTIGFGFDAPLLQDTADNGQGEYLTAWDLESLESSLSSVLTDIVARTASSSAVAVTSGEESSGDKVFRATFTPGTWRGQLEAFELPVEPGDSRTWEAGELLAARSDESRTIYTWHNESQIRFERSRASSLRDKLGASTVEAAAELIDYIRGEDVAGYRDRDGWKLGDIVSATPRVVAAPSNFYLDPDYQDFLDAHVNRSATLYVGANDGMLHAFRASDGHELWAFVPAAVMGHLQDLADPNYCHSSYVDLTANVYDVFLNGAWRTVLFGGLGNGGDSYFAIDVTYPDAPQVLWETSVPQIHSSYTEPILVNTPAGTYLWSGSGPDDGGTAVAAVIDVVTGAVAAVGQLGSAAADVNGASQAAAYDQDWDGFVDFVYQTDLVGNLWRWDVRAGAPTSWTAERVYAGTQPIQSTPSLSVSPHGHALIYFGTGRYLEPGDVYDDQTQSFVAIRDDGTLTGLTSSDLLNQTTSIGDAAGVAGWKIDLVYGEGERVIEPAVLVDGILYFTSFAPTPGACASGGTSWLYRLNYLDGSKAEAEPQDPPSPDGRAVTLESGIASRAVVGLDRSQVIVQTSEAVVNSQGLVTVPRRLEIRGWRQTYK